MGAAIAFVAAVALFGAASTARNALTWIVLGFLFALALEPVVGRVERLFGRRWAAVLTVVLAAAAAVVAVAFLVAPIAAREAGHFADDAPKLVERIGDLPLVGDRLVEAKVPEHIQQWVQQLPGQLGTEDAPLVNAFRSALSGLTAAIATVAMVLAVLLDGRRLRNGIRRLVPAARRDGADRALDILYMTVGRYFAGSLLDRRPGRLRDPHRRAARRRAAGPRGRGVGHGHQPHPPGGRVPRRRALRPARGHPGPDDAPDLPGLVPRVPAVREPRPATGDRRRGRRPLAAGHDDRRARRGLRLRRARCARGHPRDRHGEGDRHRAGLGAGPEPRSRARRSATTRDGSGGSSAPVADDRGRDPGPAPSRAGPVDRRSPHWSSRPSS